MTSQTVVAILVMSVLAICAYRIWPTRFNPLLLLILAWMPAVVFTTVPVQFITATYAVLNHGVGIRTYAVLVLAFVSFAGGTLVARELTHWRRWNTLFVQRSAVEATRDSRLWILFLIGLAVFVFAFGRSGLINQLDLDPEEVYEGRTALHLGPISFTIFLLDVTSVVFFAKYLETRRLRYVLPLAITLVCYGATLQKSRMMFNVLAAVFVMMLYPRHARAILWGGAVRKAASVVLVVCLMAALFVMNAIRGIGLIRYTDFESPLVEQAYIYSGGTAILNLGGTLERNIPADEPAMGKIIGRPVFWYLVDRDQLQPTKNLEGINNGTFLLYQWWDFREAGVTVISFLIGGLVTLMIYAARRKTLLGLSLGAIGFYAVLFSIYTDVLFDAATSIFIVIAIIAHALSRRRTARRSVVPAFGMAVE